MYPFSILYLLQSLEKKKFVIVPRGVCFQVMQGKADCNICSGESRKSGNSSSCSSLNTQALFSAENPSTH